jgi:hypothetical protein
MVKLPGRIVRGCGDSSKWYAKDAILAQALQPKLAGQELFNGTINVLVSVNAHPELLMRKGRPFFVVTELGPDWIRLRQCGLVPYRRCTLKKSAAEPVDGFLVRTEWPGSVSEGEERPHRDDRFAQFEVFAVKMDIAYGDEVELTFDETAAIRCAQAAPSS